MVAILFILTIAAFIVVDVVRARRAENQATEGVPAREVPAAASLASLLMPALTRYAVPAGVFLHKGHTWAHLDVSGNARIGIDGFARGILGKIDAIEKPAAGTRVAQGEKLFTAVQGTRRIDFVSPLNGVVREVNGKVPDGEQWLLALEPSSLSADLKRLRVASEAARWLENEMRRFAEFLTARVPRPCEVGATLQDGGIHIDGIYETLDEESRKAFAKDFLK